MKKYLAILALNFLFSSLTAQQMKSNENLSLRISQIEDRIAIKNVVDTFSILADTKETQKQTLLFTDDAIVESFNNGKLGAPIKGRKAIGDAFASFLSNFEVVYHINGQQTVTLNGDKASGISYCQVTLVGSTNGKKIRTTFGVYYHDEFVRMATHWLIAKRTSTFAWTDHQEMSQ